LVQPHDYESLKFLEDITFEVHGDEKEEILEITEKPANVTAEKEDDNKQPQTEEKKETEKKKK